MQFTVLLIAALVLLPAAGLVVWAGLAMSERESDLSFFAGVERRQVQR